MTQETPLALKLANQYETGNNEVGGESWCCPVTAAELRRLYAENVRLNSAINGLLGIRSNLESHILCRQINDPRDY